MATTIENSAETNAPQNDGLTKTSDSPTQPPDVRKRKVSPEPSTLEDDGVSKRARRDSPIQASDAKTEHERKAPSVQEEKKRNKRLFGGLISTLSQSSASNPTQKRRLEIERRQQDRMQQQREEDEQARKERGDKRRAERIRDGIGWEEEVMRNRHKRMLACARFLKTKARPAVYYLPSKRSVDQDDTIEDQIRRTTQSIQREDDEFAGRKMKHKKEHGQPKLQSKYMAKARDTEKEDMVQDVASASPPQPQEPLSLPNIKKDGGQGLTPTETTSIASAPPRRETHGDHDESGDEVVDAEEDMVIY